MPVPFSRSRVALALTLVLIFSLGLHLAFRAPSRPKWTSYYPAAEKPVIQTSQFPCRDLATVEDLVVVMRTGATEIQDKLPKHFQTTFQCFDNLLVFSDYEELFQDYPVHDVLKNMNPDIVASNPDFEIYRRLKAKGRSALRPEELSGGASFEGSKVGKIENPGWKLDKWKFLPMIRESLDLRPEGWWFVFVESDSYVVWSNLLQWIKKLDPYDPHYYGSENMIGFDVYAHGGSVFVLSRPAMEKVAKLYAEKPNYWHHYTAQHWAGDCILGKALKAVDVDLTYSWPMFQGGHPEKMDFSQPKAFTNEAMWCRPALSYHHLASPEVERMWNLEQEWIRERLVAAANENRKPFDNRQADILHHGEIFRKLVLPNITADRSEWNNLSPDLVVVGNHDYETCKRVCRDNADCLQFSVGPPGCSIGTKFPELGQRWADYQSHWMNDRVDAWMARLEGCKGVEGWSVT